MWLEVVVAVVVAVVLGARLWYRGTAGHCRSTRSMQGKTVIVTGGSAGIGKEAARDLLRRGARVILACRNLEKARRVAGELRASVAGSGEVVVRRLDTSDLTSVRTFAKEVLDTEKAVHVLINNAGIFGPKERQESPDGLELTMATNHFGHFLLTNLLLGRLKESAPSRVVNVSSGGHEVVRELDLTDLGITKSYEDMKSYSYSKLCNVLFTCELAEKMAGTGVTTNSLHPGVVNTDILSEEKLTPWVAYIRFLFFSFGKTPASGAQTTIHLAVAEELEGVTGKYFVDCQETQTSALGRRKDLARGLWEASVRAVKLQQDELHY